MCMLRSALYYLRLRKCLFDDVYQLHIHELLNDFMLRRPLLRLLM